MKRTLYPGSLKYEPDATPVELNRDMFMRNLIANLGHLNEGVLGSDVTGAYIMNVGLSMGAQIEELYKNFWQIERSFTVEEYTQVIVDLKQKINGNFSPVYVDEEKVVVKTTSCPFDKIVRKSPSLCYMTSSVFGGIASRNFGYAKVALNKRIALGDEGCHVTVYLKKTDESQASDGKEYYPDRESASPDIHQQLQLIHQLGNLRTQLSGINQRYQLFVENTLEGITVLESNSTIAFTNPALSHLLGLEADEFIGKKFSEFISSDLERNQFLMWLEQAREGTKVSGVNMSLIDKQNNNRFFKANLAPLTDVNGRNSGVLITLIDITREKVAQDAKDTFLSSAAHELRTPVTILKGYIQLLSRMVKGGKLSETSTSGENEPQIEETVTLNLNNLLERLQRMEQSSRRLETLIDRLLDLTRLQNMIFKVNPEYINCTRLISEIIERVKVQQEAGHYSSKITIELEPPDDSEINGEIDPVRFEQALTNLLDNAIKYSIMGGKVTVSYRLLDATDLSITQPRQIYISIKDEGIGIPLEQQSQIFEPFVRGSIAERENIDGLGMGLTICRGIIEKHQGQIWVESKGENEGSTFHVVLPLSRFPA
jgi:PAS domain S-box-containing protein